MNFKINELILRLAIPPSLSHLLYSPIYFITINIFAIHGFGAEIFIQQVWSKHRKISCFQIDTFPPKWQTDISKSFLKAQNYHSWKKPTYFLVIIIELLCFRRLLTVLRIIIIQVFFDRASKSTIKIIRYRCKYYVIKRFYFCLLLSPAKFTDYDK